MALRPIRRPVLQSVLRSVRFEAAGWLLFGRCSFGFVRVFAQLDEDAATALKSLYFSASYPHSQGIGTDPQPGRRLSQREHP